MLLIIWQFYKDLFVEVEEYKKIRWLLGLGWFAGTLLVSELFHIPLLNFFVNIVFLLLMTLVYDGMIGSKILGTCIVAAISAVCDYLSYQIFKNHMDSDEAYLISYIFTVLLFWICERMGANIIKKIKGEYLNAKEINILLVFPICSMGILIALTYSEMNGIFINISTVGVLIICFMTFYIYHFLLKNILAESDRKVLEQQVKGYSRELKRVEESEIRIEGLRHDLRHHLIEIRDMAISGKNKEIISYVNEIEKDIPPVAKYSRSGRYEIDSLVNFLLEEAEEKLGSINVKIAIPDNLDVNIYQLNIILGNLLENAIQAASESKEKQLTLTMDANQGLLFVEVINSYEGDLLFRNGKYISTKKDKNKHGIGLQNVKRIVQEKNGELQINTENGLFSVKIMMYI